MAFPLANTKRPILNVLTNAIDAAGRAIRNSLIKRSALSHTLALNGQALITALGQAPRRVADVARDANLGVTCAASGLGSDVDLGAADWPFIFDVMKQVAEVTGETIHVLGDDSTWKDMTAVKFGTWVQKPNKSGFVELAIADKEHRLADRLSINLWRQVGGGIEAVARTAPIKKVIDAAGLSKARSDAFVESVDVVYTWVNAEDPGWRELVAPYRKLFNVDQDRFAQVDELKYSIRSLFTFAPWVRKVFIFSNCAPPVWFKPSERVQWVMHNEVIPERYLPLFSSHAIETFLHEIPGLSERYVYFNDDVFLSAAVRPTDFFNAYGHSVSRMESSGAIEHLMQSVKSGNAEEWQHAAVNCANLMLRTTGVLPSKLHCHAPHVYSRSVYSDLAATFPEQLEITRNARFRQRTDYSFSSFMYHHFALWRGRAAHVNETAMVVRATNYKRFLSNRVYSAQRFFCVNDGGGSANDADFRHFKDTFLSKHYGLKSPAET
ncbi:stealth conserved region 3 domain-containing protein [Sinorhizobium medicae]|uniref:stealth conserved region 3 domain-containing protein n=1 Tax=Sinorhizobium medicae TaxID=110321 RepID=UPI002AF6AF5C|nr:stealth conserved region 3 domain-containing protein [Sinorhizobium medicae]WQO47237.1 stealth conserved region 3 domain-containing protein [Sinorhizobium medicae]WQO67435.1 stealth conserved region 3 domain-containing protein [Sinorhizobium medicae]WQO74597.1 stealth conserved region 3 domain-containing protein [Sinorhizobium medicae]WQO90513.1 stealth conserved region 3 domain-containing protein [Sinorhizobium medicae]